MIPSQFSHLANILIREPLSRQFGRWETLSYTRCTYNKRPATPGALCPLDSPSPFHHRSGRVSLFCLCPVSLSLFLQPSCVSTFGSFDGMGRDSRLKTIDYFGKRRYIAFTMNFSTLDLSILSKAIDSVI